MINTGSGIGFSIGLMNELGLNQNIRLMTSLDYSIHSNNLNSLENELINLDGEAVPGTIDHVLNTDFTSFSFSVGFDYEILNSFSVFLGSKVGLINSATFDSRETLVHPEDRGTFQNGRRIRNENSGNINDYNQLYGGITGGLRYFLPLSNDGKFLISPNISFDYGLSSFIPNNSWTSNNISIGVSIHYSFEDDTDIVESYNYTKSKKVFEPEIIKNPQINISAVGLNHGKEIYTPTMNLETSTDISDVYILNYVFFDKEETELPKYLNLINKISTNSYELPTEDAIETNKELLNIIGYRLNNMPNSTISLKALKDSRIASVRKEKIKKYFVEVWDIEPERIEIEQLIRRGKEKEFQFDFFSDAIEINTNYSQILEPLTIKEYSYISTPDSLRFYNLISDEEEYKNWNIEIFADGRLIQYKGGLGRAPQKYELQFKPNFLNINSSELSYTLKMTDIQNNLNVANKGLIPLKFNFTNNENRVYYLQPSISSNFELNLRNSETLKKIRSEISENTNVTIITPSHRSSSNRARNLAVYFETPNIRIEEKENISLPELTAPEIVFHNSIKIILDQDSD